MQIQGTSTLHDWTCNVTKVDGVIEMDNKVLTAAKQLEKLKLEINDLRKNIAVSEVQIEHN